MDTKIVFGLILAIILVVLIFMLNSNSIMKGISDNVFGIHGKINTEFFSNAKNLLNNKSQEFVPAFDKETDGNSYEERNQGPAPAENYEKYSPLSGYDNLNLNENKKAAAQVMNMQTQGKNRKVSISNKPVITLLGSGAPPANELKPSLPDPYQTLSVDGKPGSPKSMFIFNNNPVSTDCCPSQYTSDLGCVCLTDDQKNLLQNRGENRSAPSEY